MAPGIPVSGKLVDRPNHLFIGFAEGKFLEVTIYNIMHHSNRILIFHRRSHGQAFFIGRHMGCAHIKGDPPLVRVKRCLDLMTKMFAQLLQVFRAVLGLKKPCRRRQVVCTSYAVPSAW